LEEPEVGPWAREKLGVLGDYLHQYSRILNKQSRWLKGHVYIDAFAGTGQAKVRRHVASHDRDGLLLPGMEDEDQAQYLQGSPRVALDVEPPFTRLTRRR